MSTDVENTSPIQSQTVYLPMLYKTYRSSNAVPQDLWASPQTKLAKKMPPFSLLTLFHSIPGCLKDHFDPIDTQQMIQVSLMLPCGSTDRLKKGLS